MGSSAGGFGNQDGRGRRSFDSNVRAPSAVAVAKCSTWNIGILSYCGIKNGGHRGHAAAMAVSSRGGRALPWVFCAFSPWSDSSLADTFGASVGALCAGREAARSAGTRAKDARYPVVRTGTGSGLRLAHHAARDTEGRVQAAPSEGQD